MTYRRKSFTRWIWNWAFDERKKMSTSESGFDNLKLSALIWENTKYILQNMTCKGYIRGKESRKRSPEIVLVFQTKPS